MLRSPVLLLVLSLPAFAADVGDVAVINDPTGAIHGDSSSGGFTEPMQSRFCRETAKAFYLSHPDEFDGLVTFTTRQLSDFDNIQQGTPVKADAQGIGRDPFNWTAQYGSAGKLGQCVFMASLPRLPNSPDNLTTGPFGAQFGLTGVELLAHEYGHHWLMSVNFDKGDGQGPMDTLRGYENDQANNHYSGYTNTPSVMYGEYVTDHHDGSFSLTGGPRKYTELDQYLMGLRDASEVSPVWTIDDGSHHGNASIATPPGMTWSAQGTAVTVDIADIIRANGPRIPDSAHAQKCFRVAFVLVTDTSTQPSAADLQKVDSYRARFSNFFSTATDGRGTMDTRLVGSGCLTASAPVDAGTPPSSALDAGTSEVPPSSGNEPPNVASPEQPSQGAPATPDAEDPNGYLKPTHCGCNEAPAGLVSLLALAFTLRRRRW